LNEGFRCNCIKTNTYFVYNFIVCCLGKTLQHLLVPRHLCFERKKGDHSITNRVLKIPDAYQPCIEYTRFPRVHFKPMVFLKVFKKKDKIFTVALFSKEIAVITGPK
jgi:hypothetical protein